MIQRIRASEYREQPWKNGGGLTREIAVALSDEREPRVLWRLSLATIERDAPFSEFRGYDRSIVTIDGGPLELEVEGQRVSLERAEPYSFPGEARVAASLQTPARDLNVMTLRDGFVHDLEIVTSAQRFVVDDDELVFIFAIEGTASLAEASCDRGDTLWLRSNETIEVRTTGYAAVVRITPV